MRTYIGLLLVFLASFPASASSTPDHWVEVRSQHFVVLSNSSEKQARHVSTQFERMRLVFHTLFPNISDGDGTPITVLALKDKKDMQALEPESYLAKGQIDLAGLFLRGSDRNYILMRLDASGDHPYATVYHEYVHYLLRKTDEWMPLWLNEGLAQFYQYTDIQDKNVLLGQVSENEILYLRQNSLLPLPVLFKVDHNSPYYHEEQKGSAFYAESWALTHFIQITDREKNTHQLEDYVQLLSKHEDSVVAAQKAFGDLGQLQKKLDYYIQQGSFKFFIMKTAVVVDESAVQVRHVAMPEIDAVRADILVDNGRTKEAKALLEESLEQDPNNALAHEAMGFLKFREGDIQGAQKWFGEAVKLDSASCLANYYYASISMEIGDRDHDDAIESALRTAIKINPKFAPSYDALAMFYAMRHEKLTEAHLLNAQAVQLEPSNLRYRINTAQVLAQQNQTQIAISVLKTAAPFAKTPEEKAILQSQIEDIQHFQASLDGSHTVASPQPNETAGDAKLVIADHTEPKPKFPAGPPSGPHKNIKGVLRNVHCFYPNTLSLGVELPNKTVALYSNNFIKIEFSAANFTPAGTLDPCHGIEGMKAKVDYAEVTDNSVSGQIVSVELSK